jgi:hypothetical protein
MINIILYFAFVGILLAFLSFIGSIPYGIIAYRKSKIKDGSYHCYQCNSIVGYRKDGDLVNYGKFDGDVSFLNCVNDFDNVIQFSLERRKKK